MRFRLCSVFLVLFALLGCSKSEDGGSIPIIVDFLPSQANVSPSGSTLLVANYLGGTATVDQGVGPIASGVPISVSPAKTTTYTLTLVGTKGDVALAKATVTVGTRSLAIAPMQVTLQTGGTQAFSAVATGLASNEVTWFAERGTIDAAGLHQAPATTGSYLVSATSTADKTLCAKAVVTVVASVPVSVGPVSPANPTLTVGSAATFSATATGGVTNALRWTASAGVMTAATGAWTAPAAPQSVTITATSVENPLASSSTTVTVVAGVPVSVGPVSPANPTLTAGSAATFSATATGGVTNALRWTASAGVMTAATGAWTAPAAPQSVTITATSVENPLVSSSTTVTVVAAPVITAFTATPATIAYGSSSTLTATFANGTGAVDQGVGAVTSGVGKASGPLTAARTFTLTVTNAAGTSVTQPVTVAVTPIAVGALSPAAPTVSVGAVRTFSTTVTGGVSNAVTWTATAGTMDPATGQWTAPATAQSVTIRATSVEDPTQSSTTTATVVALPVISAFTLTDIGSAGPLWVFDGTFTGGTGVIDRGVGAFTSGVQLPLGGLPLDLYTLTVTNAAGDSVTRTASGVQLVIETSNPSELLPGEDLSISVTISNATNTTATYSASVGSVTPTGVYTAPMAVKAATVTITTVADPTVSATLTVNVIPMVHPASQVVAPGSSFVFRSAVLGIPNTAVTWSMSPATFGTVSSQGVFTSNGTTGSFTLTATSQADPTLSGTAFVTVQPSFIYANNLTATTGAAITSRRSQHALTRIHTGPGSLVLVSGGLSGGAPTASLETFNPSGQFWSVSGVSLLTARSRHTATQLSTGKILIAGGLDGAGNPLASAELYDPKFDTLVAVAPGAMTTARADHTATLLPDGRVLLAGGTGGAGTLASLELYDPGTNAFTAVSTPMANPRVGHAAEALLDGRILLAGGSKDGSDSNLANTADLYDPATGAVTPTGTLSNARRNAGAVVAADGQVTLMGGVWTPSVPIVAANLDRFNPATGLFSAPTSSLSVGRNRPLVTILADGTALALGGSSDLGSPANLPGLSPTGTLDVYNPISTALPTFGFNVPPVGVDQLKGRCTLLFDGTVLLVGDALNGSGAPVGSVIYQ